jgi:multiple sugar transport system permease protein
MFPPILLGVPMFILWRQIGIINTFPGLILAEVAMALPFSMWLMWQFFQSVPPSLEASARVCGASHFRSFYDVAIPVARPGIVATAIFGFSVAWNQFALPLVLTTDSSRWVLTVGITSYARRHDVVWGEVMAASVLLLVPPFLFIYYTQSYLAYGFRLES